jgi:lipoprotein-anchoring transpeptidase ErfK/SrfK
MQISASARQSTQALHLMGTTYDNLMSLQQIVKQLGSSNIDVAGLTQAEQYDLQLFRQASTPSAFSLLNDQIGAQLQETVTFSTQAIPFVGSARLKALSTDIDTLKSYGQNVTVFQKELSNDQAGLSGARSVADFLKVSAQIDSDVSGMQLPLVQGEASYLLQQFHREVTNWGQAHQYHDSLNGNSYNLDYPYDQQGIGSDADSAMQAAQTLDDYQAVIDLVNTDMLHLKAMQADYADTTPWNQPHATDMQVLKNYNLSSSNSGRVIVVSLIEQALRLYQNGQLVKAFQITSGQFDKPSPPGFWHIFLRQSPTVFKSSEPKGSAFWYPDTNINFALEYHDGGYFFHDSWWRADYGPGTNFPHNDSSGNQSFSGNGSHGCINMQEDQAGWLYHNTSYGDAVIIY